MWEIIKKKSGLNHGGPALYQEILGNLREIQEHSTTILLLINTGLKTTLSTTYLIIIKMQQQKTEPLLWGLVGPFS